MDNTNIAIFTGATLLSLSSFIYSLYRWRYSKRYLDLLKNVTKSKDVPIDVLLKVLDENISLNEKIRILEELKIAHDKSAGSPADTKAYQNSNQRRHHE